MGKDSLVFHAVIEQFDGTETEPVSSIPATGSGEDKTRAPTRVSIIQVAIF